jgi:GGDEF domain-containing protein
MTASFGVAVYPDHGIGADELIKAADVALYGRSKPAETASRAPRSGCCESRDPRFSSGDAGR